MNRPLRRVALACLVLFVLLLANANYVQVVRARDLQNRPGNARVILAEYERERGAIVVGDKRAALSKETEGDLRYLRRYPQGKLYAQATGFYSFVYGATGVERSMNDLLAGTDDRLFVRRVVDTVTGRPPQGGTVKLTLDPAAQQAAYDALDGQNGAVVALRPRTGEILAMTQFPSYDPNELSMHDRKAVTRSWNQLNADEDDPLENRPIVRRYPPGSLFKVVTAAAALSSGKFKPSTEVDAPQVLDLPQTTVGLPNYSDSSCGDGRVTVTDALRQSCNTAFGTIGLRLGGQALRKQAEAFGFNSSLTMPMRVTPSVFPADPNPPQTAQSAIGQFDVAATPLQMAMVAAGVANDGVVMQPTLIAEVQAPDLTPLEVAKPTELGEAVTPQVAAQLTDMMVTVVDDGTGANAQIPGVKVAGKTGTAQAGEGVSPHVWFMAFAPADDPQIAVAVVVENGGRLGDEASGGAVAAPMAKQVLEAVLQP
ncbi:penicillin-binding transpeptidase domain-containing protein [soil metagenome]